VSTVTEGGLVELAAVDSELARLRGGPHGASVRATTLNLMVYAPDPDSVSQAERALNRIGGGRPLRALVLTPGKGKATARVSSSCWLGSTGQEVCSEQVVIEADPAALPSSAVPVLVPDLPVFLLWLGPVEDVRALLEELSELATRLIVDSDQCGIGCAESVRGLTPSLTDLAWTRLAPWREALAALGDSPGGLRAYQRAHMLEVRGPANEAALLAGWLRSRLGRQIGLDHSGRTRHLERVAVAGRAAWLSVERTGRTGVGRAVGPDGLEHPVVLPRREWAWLVAAELDRLGSDPVFEAALAAAGDPVG
jgi:glucose-6-phosphate dehydrogenase assembly protein OpcA